MASEKSSVTVILHSFAPASYVAIPQTSLRLPDVINFYLSSVVLRQCLPATHKDTLMSSAHHRIKMILRIKKPSKYIATIKPCDSINQVKSELHKNTYIH